MPASLSPTRILWRSGYALSQAARVAWYAGHYAVARRIAAPIDRPGDPPFRSRAPLPDWAEVRRLFLDLFRRDVENIEAGLYPAPRGFDPARLPQALERSRAFFRDVPRVDRRRIERDGVEIRREVEAVGAQFPAYFLQNFHFQSGGWMTRESARLYDTQVEVLFTGAAEVMRRMALAPLARSWRGRDQRTLTLLDVACGTGSFLAQVLTAYPRLQVTGLDLSPAYADEARATLAGWPRTEVVRASADAMPFEGGSFNTLSCIYLFHELPPRVRVAVMGEMARVLKPGGTLVLADSIQTGDTPTLDRMLDFFPVGFHEPFYASWMTTDIARLAEDAGLEIVETELAFLTKVVTLRRRLRS